MRVPKIALLACALALTTAASAGAATVSLSETPTFNDTTDVGLEFVGQPNEANNVTVELVDPAEAQRTQGTYEMSVLDTGAPLTPGTGCSGGGAPGTAAVCAIHVPVPPEIAKCERDLGCTYVPGSGWNVSMRFVLGDGGSHLDASRLPTPPTVDYTRAPMIGVKVIPGAGDDTVLTSGGDDEVASSAGADTISTGDGNDTLQGGAAADGADMVDLGPGMDTAKFGERSEDLLFADGEGGEGGPGEGDTLSGIEIFEGGSGNDHLTARSAAGSGYAGGLVGGPGDDFLVGGEGGEVFAGGPGDDTVFAGGGNDEIHEYPTEGGTGDDDLYGGSGNDVISAEDGNDMVAGEAGDDQMRLGPGDDRAAGGSGDDMILGGPGRDGISGGEGDDRIAGEAGADELDGNDGNDAINSGSVPDSIFGDYFLRSAGPLENEPDTVDCGFGGTADRAGVDRFDTVTNCEKVIRLSRLEVAFPYFQGLSTSSLAAQVQFVAREAGKMTLKGPGLKTYRSQAPKRYEEDPGRLLAEPTGRALKRERRTGSVNLRATIVLKPRNGPRVVRHRMLHLLLPAD